jgi:hypothetical protein
LQESKSGQTAGPKYQEYHEWATWSLPRTVCSTLFIYLPPTVLDQSRVKSAKGRSPKKLLKSTEESLLISYLQVLVIACNQPASTKTSPKKQATSIGEDRRSVIISIINHQIIIEIDK